MNYIRVLFAILLTSVVAAAGQVHAADNFDWYDDISSSYSYDGWDDELSISVTLDDVDSRPDDDYEVSLRVDGRTYTRTMSYSSSRDELESTFNFYDIDSNDLDDYLDIDVTVRNEDDDDEIEFDWDFSFSRSNGSNSSDDDDLDFEDIVVIWDYDSSRDRLIIRVRLEDVNSSPNQDYTVELRADGEYYDDDFDYSTSQDELYSNITISNVDSWDLDDFRDVRVRIFDEDDDQQFSDFYDASWIDSDAEELFEDLTAEVVYNRSTNKLEVTLEVEDVDSTPSSYDAEIKIDWKTYTRDFNYNSSSDTLKSFLSFSVFSESNVESYYTVEVDVENDDNDTVYEDSFRVRTLKTDNGNSNSGAVSSSNMNTTQTKALKFIYKVEQKYSTTVDRRAYLVRVTNAIERVRGSYENQDAIDVLQRTFLTRIAEYESGQVYVPISDSINSTSTSSSSSSSTVRDSYKKSYVENGYLYQNGKAYKLTPNGLFLDPTQFVDH